MGATSVTGKGNPFVINKGSVHNTLGYQHIVDLPKFCLPYTDFPPDGNWNTLNGSGTIQTFYIGLYNTAFYIWHQFRVNADLITSEEVIKIVDPDNVVLGVAFNTMTSPNLAPYPFRVVDVTLDDTVLGSHVAQITWLWNGLPFNLYATVSPPF